MSKPKFVFYRGRNADNFCSAKWNYILSRFVLGADYMSALCCKFVEAGFDSLCIISFPRDISMELKTEQGTRLLVCSEARAKEEIKDCDILLKRACVEPLDLYKDRKFVSLFYPASGRRFSTRLLSFFDAVLVSNINKGEEGLCLGNNYYGWVKGMNDFWEYDREAKRQFICVTRPGKSTALKEEVYRLYPKMKFVTISGIPVFYVVNPVEYREIVAQSMYRIESVMQIEGWPTMTHVEACMLGVPAITHHREGSYFYNDCTCVEPSDLELEEGAYQEVREKCKQYARQNFSSQKSFEVTMQIVESIKRE